MTTPKFTRAHNEWLDFNEHDRELLTKVRKKEIHPMFITFLQNPWSSDRQRGVASFISCTGWQLPSQRYASDYPFGGNLLFVSFNDPGNTMLAIIINGNNSQYKIKTLHSSMR